MEERRVNFKVEAFNEREKISEGTHQRAIINVARFAARLSYRPPGLFPRAFGP